MGAGGPGVSVRPSVQGGRKAYPRRWLVGASSRTGNGGNLDQSKLVAACVVAKRDSISRTLTRMQQDAVLAQLGPSRQVAMASKDDEPGLKVVTVYQDPLTRHWATELW